jgi:translocation-and-assembly-module (TAM) inner membrane subunit TamB-like protein
VKEHATPIPPEQPADETGAAAGTPARKRRTHPLVRVVGILVAIVAAIIVATLTVDLGPSLRRRAETAGSNYLKRPMHIGKLSVRLSTGSFIVENLVIEGLRPTDRPFLKAKRIAVNMPWWSIFNKELIIRDVDMSDWEMLVEQFKNGHNFPKITPESKGPKGPKRFVTTVRSVTAHNGQFTYEDHTTPWSTVARNLSVSVWKGLDTYRGTTQFTNGTVAIQSYRPFRADMQTAFKIEDGKVYLDRINLTSEGAKSAVTGYVDIAHWPEMLYQVHSHVDFPIEKDIFFKDMNFGVTGQADFTGAFHFFKGGRELKGRFTTPQAGVNVGGNAWRFQNVAGSLLWIPSKFEVTDVTTSLYGGRAKFLYSMAPLGAGPEHPTQAVWDALYTDVDLAALTDFLQTQGLRLSGRATGHNRLEWPLGKFNQKRGAGEITAAPPAGMRPMTREMTPDAIAKVEPLPIEQGPFNSRLWIGYVPVGGRITYRLDPDWITIGGGSWAATEKTYVEFSGQTAWLQHSRIPFHVTSVDWQESDRLLAGIMTAFGSSTGAIPIGGRGQFDGLMLESFSKPRIEGHFAGDRMRAWDVVWGRGTADLVIENSYVTISNSLIQHDQSEIAAEGRFSLGYPRRDNGEELNAVVRMTRRSLADLRHAFELDDYPVNGLASGDYHIWGKYQTPDGFGRLQIDEGVAYGETFEAATSNLRFEGNGVRLDAIDVKKSTGRVTGAAWVGWDGNYSFDATGARIPVESLASVSFPRAPLSGIMQFNATGVGTFESPRYDVKLSIADLFAGDEGIGQVSGRLSMRGEMLTMEMEAASPRLSVSGSGRVALTPEMDAEITLRVSDTSLDPYIRFFQPSLSPFTTAVADGTIRVVGELSDVDHLLVEANVEQLRLKLFDYPAHNDGPIKIALNQHRVDIQRFRLAGEGTALELGGTIGLHDSTIALNASGDANLGILQGFSREIRSSGTAALNAEIRGDLNAPVFAGSATIKDGRFRYSALPNSLQSINGRLQFDAQGIRIVDATAELGGGKVQFGGRIGIKGFAPADLNLTATGEQMNLRYPEGFRSVVDATLALRGDIASPLLSGRVVIVDGVYTKRFEPNVDIFNLGGGATALPSPVATTPTIPLRFDIQVSAPSTLRVENNLARLVSRADLTLGGTYDRPQLFGRAEVDRGDILFEGNRYVVTRGTIDFLNPARIEPFFDIEAETHVRAATTTASAGTSETYRVTIAISGTLGGGRMNMQLNSDPPLAPVDIIALLFGQAPNLGNAELNALRPSAVTQSEEALLRQAFVRLAAGPIAAPVSRVLEQTFGISTVQIAPSLGTENDPLTPTARLILGKRLSSRAYLTYSRALGTTNREQIIILEYDQSQNFGWVLTQNGDRTFSVDFRVRRQIF